jgi:lipopolysaccharide assembly protein A
MRIFSYIFLLVLMLFGITFAALNASPVVFNYYFNSKQISLALLLVAALGFGILLGFIFMLFTLIKLKKDNYQLKSRLKVVEKELENLRSLPIKGE